MAMRARMASCSPRGASARWQRRSALPAALPRRRRGAVMMTATFLLPLLLLLFAFTRTLALSLVVLLAVGGANIVANNLANSLVQSLTPDHVRGRVMGVYMLTFFGFMPVGALLVGNVGDGRRGAPDGDARAAGTAEICAVVLVLAVPSLRRLE